MADDPLEQARRWYVEELRYAAGVEAPEVAAAFATVPREHFLMPGPIRILGRAALDRWLAADEGVRAVYHDVLIAYDAKRGINNGQPSLWFLVFAALGMRRGEAVLHLGSGVGYYSAILAEMVGPTGHVLAIEIEADIAARAQEALAPWPQVAARQGDGSRGPFAPVGVIVASAGATHPLPAWLDALKPGGRLAFPMTGTGGRGGMLLVTRAADAYAARFLTGVGFIDFTGARDEAVGKRLNAAFARDFGAKVRSLRRDRHVEDGTCWLHGQGWCLSRRAPS
jgi:protein-L-isoaspartate(D-aspartate) O-methyltransferase